MQPWIPYDADPDEIAQLHIVRDAIPASLEPALLAWIMHGMSVNEYAHAHTTPEFVHYLQAMLRVDFGMGPKAAPSRLELVNDISSQGEKLVLRVIDLLASSHPSNGYDQPEEIMTLQFHLDTGGSAVEVYPSKDGNYRLRRRVVGGLEEIAQIAIDLLPSAGRHLASAWKSAHALEPNTSFAMTEAIRAVEAAAGPVLAPKDKKPTLGKCVAVLQQQGGWGLALHDSDGFPDHKAVLIGMLETLAKAQPDRHAGEKPSLLEAQAHIQLAATLVQWFASGAVLRDEPTA